MGEPNAEQRNIARSGLNHKRFREQLQQSQGTNALGHTPRFQLGDLLGQSVKADRTERILECHLDTRSNVTLSFGHSHDEFT
jgi:hypothetical protein